MGNLFKKKIKKKKSAFLFFVPLIALRTCQSKNDNKGTLFSQ